MKGVILIEMSNKVRQILYDITYMWNLETIISYITKKNIYNKEETNSQRENKLVVTSGERGEGRCSIGVGQ